MDTIGSILNKNNPVEKPQPKRQEFQIVALELIKLLHIEKKDQGIVWALAKRKGTWVLRKVIAEFNQGELRGDLVRYLKYLLKNDKSV